MPKTEVASLIKNKTISFCLNFKISLALILRHLYLKFGIKFVEIH